MACTLQASAFQSDTAAYQLQRQKINTLLAQRSANFGHYDSSLKSRTGIFGLRTKKDLNRSNDILRQIALTDNAIFKELKVLMDYKDLKSQAIEESASVSNERLSLYRRSIKKLQDQNQSLQSENTELTSKVHTKNYLLTALILLVAGGGYIFYKNYRTQNPKND